MHTCAGVHSRAYTLSHTTAQRQITSLVPPCAPPPPPPPPPLPPIREQPQIHSLRKAVIHARLRRRAARTPGAREPPGTPQLTPAGTDGPGAGAAQGSPESACPPTGLLSGDPEQPAQRGGWVVRRMRRGGGGRGEEGEYDRGMGTHGVTLPKANIHPSPGRLPAPLIDGHVPLARGLHPPCPRCDPGCRGTPGHQTPRRTQQSPG